ncbi:Plastin-3, partial [Astathelohania contejeani]
MSMMEEFPTLKKVSKEEKMKKEIKSMGSLIEMVLPSVYKFDDKTDFFKKLSNGIILAHLINLVSPNTIKIPNFCELAQQERVLIKKRIFIDDIIRGAQKVIHRSVNIAIEDILNGNEAPVLGLLVQIMKILLKRKEYIHLKYTLATSSNESFSYTPTNENNKIDDSNTEKSNNGSDTKPIEFTEIVDNKKYCHQLEKTNKRTIDEYALMNTSRKYLSKSCIIDWINYIIRQNGFDDLTVKNLSSDLSDSMVYGILLESIAGGIIGDVTKSIYNKDLNSRAKQIIQHINELGFLGMLSHTDIIEGHEVNNFIFINELYKRYWRNDIYMVKDYDEEGGDESSTEIVTVSEKMKTIWNDVKLFDRKVDTLIRKLEIMNMLNEKEKKKKWYVKAIQCLFG